jgi:DNA-binding NarL/FixJ family response regulator
VLAELPLRVLAVDGHPSVRLGIRAMLAATADLQLCGEADSVPAALVTARRASADLVLFDPDLTASTGADGVRLLRDSVPGVQVVVLTGNPAADLMRQCLRAGAAGYLLKTASPTMLCEALRQAARGARVVDPALLGSLVDTDPGNLTPRELDVLAAVSRGLTNRQAAGVLGTRESTVKTLLARAMAKMDASDRTHAVALGLRQGLIS